MTHNITPLTVFNISKISMKIPFRQVLRNQKDFFSSFFWISFFLVFYLFLIELFASSPFVFKIIKYPTPSMDSIYPELDVKLQRFWKAKDINCLLLGSSMVDTGIDPVLFEERINKKLNSNYRCFNFGFSSSMVEVSGSIGNTIQNTSDIDLVLWGISPIDMDPNFTKTRPIANMPAFSYYNGNPTIVGWLYNHFSLPWIIGSLPHFQNDYYTEQLAYYNGLLDDRGVRRLTDIGNMEVGDQPIFLKNYHLNYDDVKTLKRTIQEFKRNEIKIIFVEMPIHPSLYPYLIANGNDGYQEEFFQPMKKFFVEQDIPFIDTESVITEIVHDSHWANNYHLNIFGAEKFTEYILDRISNEGLLP